MRASTGLEVAAVMVGLVGAAAAMTDSRRCCDCGEGGSVKRSRRWKVVGASPVMDSLTAMVALWCEDD
jgi:hypothetical protein